MAKYLDVRRKLEQANITNAAGHDMISNKILKMAALSIATNTFPTDALFTWLCSNKLTLNTLKTDFMIIGSRQRTAALEGDIYIIC